MDGGNGAGEPRRLAGLRRCPKCQEIRRFLGRSCRTCHHRLTYTQAQENPTIESVKCRTWRCKRLVAASIDGYCGTCAVNREFAARRRSNTLSRDDRTEEIYLKAFHVKR